MITTTITVTEEDNTLYALPLKQPIYNTQKIDFKDNLRIKEELQSIGDFEKRLEYYNKNICSLSIYNMAGNIYFEWGNPEQRIKVYCGCKGCRKEETFSQDQEEIYFKLRNKEVKRIYSTLSKAKSYKDKLKVIFNVKGYSPNIPPALYGNISFDTNKDPDTALLFSKPLVNLKPETKDQIATYNHFVTLEFNKTYRNQSGFSDNYKCFDSVKEIDRLNLILQKSLDPHNLLLYIRNLINKNFNYPECLRIANESLQVQQLTHQINQMSLGFSLFPKMVLGEEINLNRIALDESELLRYTHIAEIVKYYAYVEGKIQARYNKSVEVEITIDKERLFELAANNEKYNSVLESYKTRIEIASHFSSKAEFINQEIENIEIEFVKPVPPPTANQFSLSQYSRYAYEALKFGKDKEITPFINDAKKQYVQFVRKKNPSFSEFNDEGQLERIGKDAYKALIRGVAYLLYHNFLKNELKSLTMNPVKQSVKANPQVAQSFNELFYSDNDTEGCLEILRQLQPPVIDAANNYVGKSKGIFPLWIKVLKNHKPNPIIKHFSDQVYKDILNSKISGLSLSKDASEFRKQYARLNSDKVELDIKTLLSQILH